MRGARRRVECAAPGHGTRSGDPVRRVSRQEATALLAEVRPGAVVHEVRVVALRPELCDPVVPGGQPPPEVQEFDYADGGAYAWSWAAPQMLRAGTALWCTSPVDGDPLCVRAETVLPRPEVLRVRAGTLQVLRSRFTTPQPAVVDTSVIAPADLTQGTGLTEDEALLVLRSHHARLVRTGRAWVGASCAALPIVGNAANLFFALDNPVVVGGFFALALGPPAVASAVYVGPWRRRRRRLSRPIEGGYLEPVEVVRWCDDTVTVAAVDGRSWSWPVRSEGATTTSLPRGTRAWATPLREGAYVHLVADPDEEATKAPVVLEAAGVAHSPSPPRSPVQDVVRH